MKPLLMLLGAAGVAALAWFFGQRSAAPVATAPSTDELKALKVHVEQLAREQRARGTIDTLAVALGSARAALPATGVEVARPESSASRSPAELASEREERRRQSQQYNAERRQRLDRQLAQEPPDVEWSGTAAQRIQGWLAVPALQGYSLGRVECKASLCRATFNGPADTPPEVQLNEMLMNVSDKMGDFQTSSLSVVDDVGGAKQIVGYFGRSGQPLPK